MGSSGFPFPPVYDGEIHGDEERLPFVRAGSLCSPIVLSPGMNSLRSPLAGTPSCGREREILPSIVSPVPAANDILKTPEVSNPASVVALGSKNRYVDRKISSSMDVDVECVQQASHPGRNGLSLPTPPHENRPAFRLPSFRELGIATFNPAHPIDSPDSLPVDMARVTPPSDASDHIWTPSFARLLAAGGGESANAETAQPVMTQDATAPAHSVSPVSTGPDAAAEFWEDTMERILNAVDGQEHKPTSIKVLSHSLPSPTVPGHLFPRVIESLKGHYSSSPLVWINHLHAVPNRFNVSDLPTSPPSTPGQPLGTNDGTGEDYFTVKTFESAVVAMDYSAFSDGLSVGTPASPPRSSFQQELAAPSSLNLIIVERYIPPPSTKEFVNLFSLTKPSLLSDRLFELVPGNGCVVFIYPTKRGAQTFCDKLFGPVMDPLLRGLAVVNGFSADLSKAIGTMSAVPHMYEFDGLKYHVSQLCEDIQLRSTSDSYVRQRLHGNSGRFSMIYAERKYVRLSREIWSDWWVKQEKERVRRAVTRYFRFGNRVTTESESQLTQEIFSGIPQKVLSKWLRSQYGQRDRSWCVCNQPKKLKP